MGQHILYIDDVPDHLILMQKLIETQIPGVVVDTSESISGAESKLAQRCYDLIITDVNLREAWGTEIAEAVLEADSEQPVMLVSEYVGDSIQDEVSRLKREHGVPCWPKFSRANYDDLIGMIKTLLARRYCPRLSASEAHPDFCRFKTCMREDHGGEFYPANSERNPKLVLIRPLFAAA